MKRSFLTLIMFTLLLTGCAGGGVKVDKLNITWRSVPSKSTVQGLSLSEDNREDAVESLNHYYARVPTTMDASMVDIVADLGGKTSGEFDFQLATVNSYEQTKNNTIRLHPEQAEKGSVVVSAEGQQSAITYEIFPAVVLATHPRLEGNSFDFKSGEFLDFGEGDIEPDFKVGLKAEVVISEFQEKDFWADFLAANNLHEYEYKEQAFRPELGYLYFIKTKSGGYVVMMFSAGSGTLGRYNAIYKYSETGIFE